MEIYTHKLDTPLQYVKSEMQESINVPFKF
jgi:hypothetical protein